MCYLAQARENACSPPDILKVDFCAVKTYVLKFCAKKKCKNHTKNHRICLNHETKTVKEVTKQTKKHKRFMHANLKILRKVRKILHGRTTVRPWHLETLFPTSTDGCIMHWALRSGLLCYFWFCSRVSLIPILFLIATQASHVKFCLEEHPWECSSCIKQMPALRYYLNPWLGRPAAGTDISLFILIYSVVV